MGTVPSFRSSKLCGNIESFGLFVFILLHGICLVCADNIRRDTGINITSISYAVGLMNISDICPGVEYIMNHDTNATVLRENVSDCWYNLPDFTTHQGVVYVVCGDSTIYCRLHIEVPQGMFVRAHVQRLAYWCDSSRWKTWINRPFDEFLAYYTVECNRHSLKERHFQWHTNHMFITHFNRPALKIKFEATKNHSFITRYVSDHSGYVILPNHGHNTETLHVSKDLKAPIESVIMVSLQALQSKSIVSSTQTTFRLMYTEPEANTKRTEKVYLWPDTLPRVFHTQHIQINVYVSPRHYKERNVLKLAFSFHSETYPPQEVSNGLFNCSVDHYTSFQLHLDCNLKTECEDGRDETEHCPFSSPECQGLVASYNKCFRFVTFSAFLYYRLIALECLKKGGKMATMKTRMEQEHFRQLFKTCESFSVPIGLVLGWDSGPFMYSKFRKWSENTIVYNINHFTSVATYRPSRNVRFTHVHSMGIDYFHHVFSEEAVCEIISYRENVSPVQIGEVCNLTPSLLTQTRQPLFECPDGYVIHTFVSCHPSIHTNSRLFSNESTRRKAGSILTFPRRDIRYNIDKFVCDDDVTNIPYTLVCNFRQDCPDNSDELFCEHPSCNGFQCNNGQCILFSRRCNEHSDCLDDSDEMNCTIYDRPTDHREADKWQILINLDGTGHFTQQVMPADGSCPATHYRCTADWMYCLPVYTRCNGFSDCTYGEDEQDCETVACFSLYWCRNSKICVHGDHLCDGWGQCPQRDDEWLCEIICPEGCFCQGHSVVCPESFSTDLFHQLRYVDATGSGMTLTNFSSNANLIRLSLSYCFLHHIPYVKSSNLQFIDLANNQVRHASMNVFLELFNLRVLILSNNPLLSLTIEVFNVYYALTKLDLSKTHLKTSFSDISLYLPEVKYLNLSFSGIETFGQTGFRNTPHLTELDIRGNPVNQFSLNLLSFLRNLNMIFSTNYKFCCENLLPKRASKAKCSSPQPILSTCESLLPSELYRLFFWLVSIFAVFGNLVCIVVLIVAKKIFGSYFFVFIAHLQITDLCMGIHILIVATANEMFHGKYIYFEKSWTSSVICNVAGFLSLLSSVVSVLILCFITWHHVIVVYFTFHIHQLNNELTVVVYTVVWFVGIILSMIPFLPGLSYMGLNGQSGLCCLALSDNYDSNQDLKWFIVTVFLNCSLCLTVVVGEVVIYRRTPRYQSVIDSSKRSLHSSVRLLVNLSATNIMCWFLVGLSSVAVSVEIYVVVVVYMLPLSSAVHPLLYVWTVTALRQQQEQEERLIKVFKSKLPWKLST